MLHHCCTSVALCCRCLSLFLLSVAAIQFGRPRSFQVSKLFGCRALNGDSSSIHSCCVHKPFCFAGFALSCFPRLNQTVFHPQGGGCVPCILWCIHDLSFELWSFLAHQASPRISGGCWQMVCTLPMWKLSCHGCHLHNLKASTYCLKASTRRGLRFERQGPHLSERRSLLPGSYMLSSSYKVLAWLLQVDQSTIWHECRGILGWCEHGQTGGRKINYALGR